MIYLRLLILLAISSMAQAQLPPANLSQDPVFTTILNRRLSYPRQAQWSSRYGRVFAEFTINEKGRVQDISILNHSAEGDYAGFEPSVIAALKKLPSLNLQFIGRYILPISFVLVDYRHKDKPFIPTDTLHIQDLMDRIILKEIKVMGSNINSRERIKAASGNEAY
ncbi:TonB family protein [Spirosoma sp. BT702]|uniref:TonB family protein n=1 Tax=Spirosoma profusum TaxID=2771354 RepID=A0A926XYP2_9BACT|nr:TonB family protein [Spirosoma profusum]MBD2703207.1 TonB family protein [Spirosoma profusum]